MTNVSFTFLIIHLSSHLSVFVLHFLSSLLSHFSCLTPSRAGSEALKTSSNPCIPPQFMARENPFTNIRITLQRVTGNTPD